MVRVPAEASSINRSMVLIPAAVSGNLVGLGVTLAHPGLIGPLIRDVLLGDSSDGSTQVSAADQTRLATTLDRAYLGFTRHR